MVYLQEGGVGRVQLGVALNLEDKNNCLQRKLPELLQQWQTALQDAGANYVCVQCIWRLYQLMEM